MRRSEFIPEILWRAQNLGRRVEVAHSAYQAIWWRLTSTTAQIGSERVTESRRGNREDALLIAGEKLDRLRAQYQRAYLEATEIIEQIEVPGKRQRTADLQDVLTNRYITRMSPRESARAMSFSVDYERELHREAIAAFKEAQKKAGR